MSADVNEATAKIAEMLWREANPERPVSQGDAWDYCKAQARDVMTVLAPFTTELEEAHRLIYDLRLALARHGHDPIECGCELFTKDAAPPGGDVPVESAPAAEPVTDRCAHCGDTIDLIDGKWKHRPGLRSPHDPEPWPTSPHAAATATVPHNRKETSQ